MAILVDADDAPRRPGPDRQRGPLPRAAQPRLRHERRRRASRPGKGGQDVEGIPVFDTVAEAVAETGANTTLVFVPARFAADAVYEAVDAGIGTVVCITEHIPVHDTLQAARLRPRARRDA